MKVLKYILIFTIFNSSVLSSEVFDIKLITQFYLDQTNEILGNPGDMAIDNDDNIFITDRAFSNIKIYGNQGKLIKIFGRKGEGPDEFGEPFTIDYSNGKFCFYDISRLYYYIYDREFHLLNSFFYLSDAAEFILSKNRIISNDYFRDKKGREYRGTILDFNGKVKKLLMPIKYGKRDLANRFYLSYAFLDVSNDGRIYYVRKKELKIILFDKEGKKLRSFGKSPKFYKRPQMTKSYQSALGSTSRISEAWRKWYYSFTWISGLSILKETLVIAISNFNKDLNKWQYWLQFYDLDGNILEQTKLKEPGSESTDFFMDSNNKDRIYILETTDEMEPKYKFYKYEINRR